MAEITREMVRDAFADFHLDDITWAESEELSDLVDLYWSEVVMFLLAGKLPEGAPKSVEQRVLRALTYVALRRKYPDVTFEECEPLSYTAFNELANARMQDNADPKEHGEEPASE